MNIVALYIHLSPSWLLAVRDVFAEPDEVPD